MIRFIQQRAERFIRLAKPLPAISRKTRRRTSKKRPFLWRWNGFEVLAYAKTDARGKLKRLAGLKRLPVGAVVERVTA